MVEGSEALNSLTASFTTGVTLNGLQIAPLVDSDVGGDPVELEPENDHRMAMAFGLVSLRVPQIVVRDPECVSKSFPDFWQQLQRVKQRRAAEGL